MKKIKCTLPNASTEISGVQFVQAEDGVLSDAVGDDVAAQFAGIPGYQIIDVADPVDAEKAAADAAAKAAKAASEASAKAEAKAAKTAAKAAAKPADDVTQ